MRRILATLLMSVANLSLGLAMTGWWMQHTVFDPGRTQDVAGQVLAVDGVQEQITDAITNAVATELGVDPDRIAGSVDAAASTPAGVELLSDVVVQSHSVLIGETPGPVIITPQQVSDILGIPEAASVVPVITLPVKTVGPLDAARRFLEATVVWAFVFAAVLSALAFVIHPRRDRMVRRWGFGLIMVGVAVMALGYVVPVLLLPTMTSSPWVQAIPELAKSQLGLLAGVSLVCAGLGLGLIAVAGLMRRSQLAAERDYQPPRQPTTQSWR